MMAKSGTHGSRLRRGKSFKPHLGKKIGPRDQVGSAQLATLRTADDRDIALDTVSRSRKLRADIKRGR